MVNYCCVQGCGRNSRANKYLNYYSLPKKKTRQKLWLIAAGKADLLTKDLKKRQRTLRFCSRHFAPNNIKNRHLTEDAVPTKCLPGSLSEDEEDREPAKHDGIICDNCSGKIIGFRYKCVTCENYDLCQKCEMLESHNTHYMLRIPRPLKFKVADHLINKWREFFKSEHVLPETDINSTDESSDNEPVKKYVRNHENVIDLSEDDKRSLRDEVDRALKSAKIREKNKENLKRPNTEKSDNVATKKPRTNEKNMLVVEMEMIKNDDNIKGEVMLERTPELVFADVNDTKLNQNQVKAEEYVNGIYSTGPHPEKQVAEVARVENDDNIKGEVMLEPTPELVFADVNDAKLNQNQVKAEEYVNGIYSTGPHPEEPDNLRAFYLKMGIDLSQLMIHVVPNSEEGT